MNRFRAVLIAALLLMTARLYGGDPRDQDLGSAVLSTNNPEQAELEQVMTQDDAAIDEVTSWINENNQFASEGAGESRTNLNRRIMARLQTVREAYLDFLKRHPTNAPAYLAYGSFLNDIGDEESASIQYEKSRQLDPKNPAAWNDLANYYGENSPVTNAFAYYARAVELDPTEPVYYENWGTTVYLFRKDARAFYGLNEQQVFDKALALYRKAIDLAPNDFSLRTDYASSYYGIRPLRTNDALVAWTNALKVAQDDVEREGVYIHLARVKTSIGRFAEAQAHLDAVTNANYAELKKRLERSIVQHEQAATNHGVIPDAGNVTNTVSDSTNLPVSSTGQKTP
jgi:tetratricopeptide (TPR) repeat protein